MEDEATFCLIHNYRLGEDQQCPYCLSSARGMAANLEMTERQNIDWFRNGGRK